MGISRLLVGALRPGATLKHEPHRLMPVDALFALGRCDPAGIALIHAKLGGADLTTLRVVILETTGVVFGRHGWVVHDRKRFTAAQTIAMFVEQVQREYLGEPCPGCAGRGFRGLKNDPAKLRVCAVCDGGGVVRATNRARARALKLDVAHIYRVWRARFTAVLAELKTIERRALFECALFLFDDG